MFTNSFSPQGVAMQGLYHWPMKNAWKLRSLIYYYYEICVHHHWRPPPCRRLVNGRQMRRGHLGFQRQILVELRRRRRLLGRRGGWRPEQVTQRGAHARVPLLRRHKNRAGRDAPLGVWYAPEKNGQQSRKKNTFEHSWSLAGGKHARGRIRGTYCCFRAKKKLGRNFNQTWNCTKPVTKNQISVRMV